MPQIDRSLGRPGRNGLWNGIPIREGDGHIASRVFEAGEVCPVHFDLGTVYGPYLVIFLGYCRENGRGSIGGEWSGVEIVLVIGTTVVQG